MKCHDSCCSNPELWCRYQEQKFQRVITNRFSSVRTGFNAAILMNVQRARLALGYTHNRRQRHDSYLNKSVLAKMRHETTVKIIPFSFQVTVSAVIGGQKELNQNFDTEFQGYTGGPFKFIGAKAERTMMFRLDLVAPQHCLSVESNNCSIFPIYLDQDVRTVRSTKEF